eukprot:TRINITY_DN78674_c0_g1_i1.p1 TRINITY_DN78674_c0_g1~~TRINITY_DN78674_c0_g1_i1.p1  ORF type:complete len:104 (-),score=22.98 TRINITY_DN78674_c0_g1_i1:133-444(-)
MAFVNATPILTRPAVSLSTTAFTARRSIAAAPVRRAAVRMVGEEPKIEKIPQGFTAFSENLNGRAAMLGFLLAVVTEAITGKGILGQVGSIFEIVNLASALGN